MNNSMGSMAATQPRQFEAQESIHAEPGLGGARLLEFHDQAWFPEILRDSVTDALQFIFGLGGVYRSVVPLLRKAMEQSGSQRIVDLCSGGGGPWLWLNRFFRSDSGSPIKICLTDKFPNAQAYREASEESGGQISYEEKGVDALTVHAKLPGFRTIFGSFHHFTPEQAVSILQNAVDSGEGIGVFEAAKRHPLNILSVAIMPIAGLLTAPFTRPFRWSRLFWTYIVPVIPFVLYFDGVMSCLRAYSQTELRRLVAQVKADDFVWEIGEQKEGLARITYLMGYPREPRSAERHPSKHPLHEL
jgi:hypothetical protein